MTFLPDVERVKSSMAPAADALGGCCWGLAQMRRLSVMAASARIVTSERHGQWWVYGPRSRRQIIGSLVDRIDHDLDPGRGLRSVAGVERDVQREV